MYSWTRPWVLEWGYVFTSSRLARSKTYKRGESWGILAQTKQNVQLPKINSSFNSMNRTFRIIILLAQTSLMFLKVVIHPIAVYGLELESYNHGRDLVLHLGSPGSDRGLWIPAAAVLLIGVWDEVRLIGRSDLECWCLERTFSFVGGLWGRVVSWTWSERERDREKVYERSQIFIHSFSMKLAILYKLGVIWNS